MMSVPIRHKGAVRLKRDCFCKGVFYVILCVGSWLVCVRHTGGFSLQYSCLLPQGILDKLGYQLQKINMPFNLYRLNISRCLFSFL